MRSILKAIEIAGNSLHILAYRVYIERIVNNNEQLFSSNFKNESISQIMAKAPDWIQKARNKWKYTGKTRPDFAKEPGAGQESVWDYPRPPKIDPDSRTIIVKHHDIVIAKTNNAIRILETASPPTFYIPPSDLNLELFKKVGGSSMCEWKGAATYWDVVLSDKVFPKSAWSYEDPFEEYKTIKSYLSFYPAIFECFIDGERVQPQPGGFYGGWITSEIVGPVKGEPGISG